MKYTNEILILAFFLTVHFSLNAQVDKVMEVSQDTILKKELESILIKDQTLRLILPECEEKFGKGSGELNFFWTLIHDQDSINEFEVVNIIEEHGWLGINRVGVKANRSLWLVIQHAPIEIQEKYLPLLKESVAIGESEGWYLAFLEDRILMRKGEDQIYGTQSTYNLKTGKFHIYPIRDRENVNEKRESIGLESIEEYAETNGYTLDQE